VAAARSPPSGQPVGTRQKANADQRLIRSGRLHAALALPGRVLWPEGDRTFETTLSGGLSPNGHVTAWTAERLQAEAEFAEQIATYWNEILAHTERVRELLSRYSANAVTDLPPAALREVEEDTEQLFGTRNPIMHVPSS